MLDTPHQYDLFIHSFLCIKFRWNVFSLNFPVEIKDITSRLEPKTYTYFSYESSSWTVVDWKAIFWSTNKKWWKFHHSISPLWLSGYKEEVNVKLYLFHFTNRKELSLVASDSLSVSIPQLLRSVSNGCNESCLSPAL